MIIRIVKMTFKEEEIDSFQALFAERKAQIRNFPGCTHLELWQDKQHTQLFFTYSWWLSEENLNAYRQSHFFEETWRLTKQKFSAKPEAWTVGCVHKL